MMTNKLSLSLDGTLNIRVYTEFECSEQELKQFESDWPHAMTKFKHLLARKFRGELNEMGDNIDQLLEPCIRLEEVIQFKEVGPGEINFKQLWECDDD